MNKCVLWDQPWSGFLFVLLLHLKTLCYFCSRNRWRDYYFFFSADYGTSCHPTGSNDGTIRWNILSVILSDKMIWSVLFRIHSMGFHWIISVKVDWTRFCRFIQITFIVTFILRELLEIYCKEREKQNGLKKKVSNHFIVSLLFDGCGQKATLPTIFPTKYQQHTENFILSDL